MKNAKTNNQNHYLTHLLQILQYFISFVFTFFYSSKLKTNMIVLLIFVCSIISAQTKIEILHSNSLEFDANVPGSPKKLIGDVSLRQDNTILNCDSAYYYDEENKVKAFDNIHIIHDDTINLYGEYLIFQGDKRVINFEKNVKLEDPTTILETDFLDYYLKTSIASYTRGGFITNANNTLRSDIGNYHIKQKQLFFKSNVILINPKYQIYSDTLQYNIRNKTAYFFGPTDIKSKENYIYAENGYYNTETDIAKFSKNAYLRNEKQKLFGDSLYYDRNLGLGKAFENVQLIDSTEKIILTGHYGEYYENFPERALLTDSTIYIHYTAENDSLFMHSDTMKAEYNNDKKYKLIKSYYNTKFYRKDVQGVCDSLIYSFKDSTMHMFGEPIIWNKQNQLSAEEIIVHSKNNKINKANLLSLDKGKSFMIEQIDSIRFNQVKGKNVIGYFKNEELNIVDVIGNAESIYFLAEENELLGFNKIECSDMKMRFNNGEIEKIIFYKQPTGTLFPVKDGLQNNTKIIGFKWQIEKRPKNKNDIFKIN